MWLVPTNSWTLNACKVKHLPMPKRKRHSCHRSRIRRNGQHLLVSLVPIPLLLKSSRLHNEHEDQTCKHQQNRYQREDGNAASACREFASDNPMLTLKISVKSQDEHHYTDTEKCSSQRLSQSSNVYKPIRVASIAGYGSVQSEELGDCYSDRCKRERGPQPG
jgi:hypothetical protein